MCGIVGYIGDKQAAPILVGGLKRLEYRGYDSAGVAVVEPPRLVEVVRTAGATSVGEIVETPTGDRFAMLRDPWGLALQLASRAQPLV